MRMPLTPPPTAWMWGRGQGGRLRWGKGPLHSQQQRVDVVEVGKGDKWHIPHPSKAVVEAP